MNAPLQSKYNIQNIIFRSYLILTQNEAEWSPDSYSFCSYSSLKLRKIHERTVSDKGPALKGLNGVSIQRVILRSR